MKILNLLLSAFSSLLGPNIHLRILFSNTFSLCFSLSVRASNPIYTTWVLFYETRLKLSLRLTHYHPIKTWDFNRATSLNNTIIVLWRESSLRTRTCQPTPARTLSTNRGERSYPVVVDLLYRDYCYKSPSCQIYHDAAFASTLYTGRKFLPHLR